MELLRAHLTAVAVVVAATAALGGVFAFARPAYRPQAAPSPPGDRLTHTRVAYSTADARRAFAAAGLRLSGGAQSPATSDLHDPNLAVEVTVFGPRKAVAATGFADYTLDAQGRLVHIPRTCEGGARAAERWRENVRVIVRCDAPAAVWSRVGRGLAGL